MGLKIINNPKAYATEFEKFTWELEWHPDKSYSKPITVSICCQNLCSFIHWKWIHVDADEGEIDYRTVPEPDYNDIKMRNPHMKLISVKYPSIEENEKMKFSITAQPYPQEGNSPLLELYAGEVAGKAEEKGSVRLTFRPGPVARFSVYAHPYPRESGIVRIIGVPQDRFGNSTSFDRPVDIRYCVEDKQGPSLEVLNKHIFEVNVNKQRNPVRIRAHIPIDILIRVLFIPHLSGKSILSYYRKIHLR